MESQRKNAILRKIYSPIKIISIEKGSLYSYCSCLLTEWFSSCTMGCLGGD